MSSTLREKLFVATSDAFAQQGLERRYGEILPSSRPDLGQFQCNGALAAAKAARRKPTEIAAALKAALIANPMFAEISVAGPGFMNFKLADAFLAEHMNEVRPDPRLGCPVTAQPRNVIVDFGGPNVAKAMHVGHLRSSIIGDCLQRLFRFQGHAVTSDIHMGDWGTQMGMLLCEVRRLRPDLPFFDARNTGPYPSEPVVTIDELNEMYWYGFDKQGHPCLVWRPGVHSPSVTDPDIMLRVQWGRVPDRIQAYWSDTISAILEEKPE